MRKTLVILCVLVAAAVAMASTPTSTNRSTNSSPAVKTYLLPDLTMKTVISPALLPAPAQPRRLQMQLRKIRTSGEPAAAVADFLAPPTQIAGAQAAILSSPAVTRAQQKQTTSGSTRGS